MARIRVPDGEKPEIVRVWSLRPELGSKVEHVLIAGGNRLGCGGCSTGRAYGAHQGSRWREAGDRAGLVAAARARPAARGAVKGRVRREQAAGPRARVGANADRADQPVSYLTGLADSAVGGTRRHRGHVRARRRAS